MFVCQILFNFHKRILPYIMILSKVIKKHFYITEIIINGYFTNRFV